MDEDNRGGGDGLVRPLYVSTFRHLRAVQPTGRAVEVGAMARRLGQAQVCGSREERGRSVPLWSPVRYREGARRGSDGVAEVHWLVLDYDDGTPAEVARERWSGWVHIGHTSYSHMQGRPATKTHPEGRPPAPALRVVLPLLEPVPAEVWSEVMRGILSGLGQEADSKCIDPARMFYVPVVASPSAAFKHWVHTPAGGLDGPWLCLADEVAQARVVVEERERERVARLEAVAARARDIVDSREEQEREVRRRLLEDPRAREDFGHMVGGRVVLVDGDALIRHAPCPACGRRSVWWPIEPRRQYRGECNHRNSCGYRGHLWELAALHGLALT